MSVKLCWRLLGFRDQPDTSMRPVESVAIPWGSAPATGGLPPALVTAVVAVPPEPKLESGPPLVLYRATAKRRGVAPLSGAEPTATILPSDWIFRAYACSPREDMYLPPKSVVTLPSPSKLVSSEPFVL